MRRTLARSLSLMMLCSPLGLTGCGPLGGTVHLVQQPGTVMVLEQPVKARVLGPDENGKLKTGTAEIPAGAMFQVPKEKFKAEPESK